MSNRPSIVPVLRTAVFALFLRFLLNRLSVVNGNGLVDRLLPFPFSTWWMWSLGGAAYGAYLALRIRDAQLDLGAWTAKQGDAYHATVRSDELGDLAAFGLFEDWHGGRNRVTTMLGGERCEMFDYTSIEQGEGVSYHSQTVLLLPELSEPLPRFELRPRGYTVGLLRLVAGLVGPQIKTRDELSCADTEAVARFNRQYVLFPQSIARLSEIARGDRPSAGQDLEPIRSLFSLELIRFFADHSGWCLESTGDGLAMWKWMGVIPGPQRDEMLEEGKGIFSALRKAAATPASREIDFVESKIDRKIASRSYLRLAVCVFGGFLGGFLVGMLGMANADPWNVHGINPLVRFFGPILLGLAIGILLAWWFSRPR